MKKSNQSKTAKHYFILVGNLKSNIDPSWSHVLAENKTYEMIFGDFSRSTVQYEKMYSEDYSRMLIIKLPDARQETIDSKLAELNQDSFPFDAKGKSVLTFSPSS